LNAGPLADVDPAGVPLTARHPRDNETLPIGVTVELEERTDAAWGAWRVSRTTLGDEVLELARDGVPLGLSVGFLEVPGGSRWSPDRRRVTRTRAALDHVAVVRVPRLRRSRRARRTGRPRAGNGPSARRPGPTLAVATMSGLLRGCLDCRTLVRGKSYCVDCQRRRDRQHGTRQQRGYTATHDALRRLLVAALDPWAPCPRCGHPLGPDPTILDLMHNEDRTGWLGLGHRRCNRDVSPQGARPGTPRQEDLPTHSAAPDDDGPVVA
jgi:hypothetical protein